MATKVNLVKEPIHMEISEDGNSETEKKEATKADTVNKDKIYRNFKSVNGCRKGESCHFKHEIKEDYRKHCKFWIEGMCKLSV